MEGTLEMGRAPIGTQPRNCYVSLLDPTSKKYGLIYTFVSKSGPSPFFLEFREKNSISPHRMGKELFWGRLFWHLLLDTTTVRYYCETEELLLRPSCPNSLYPSSVFLFFAFENLVVAQLAQKTTLYAGTYLKCGVDTTLLGSMGEIVCLSPFPAL